MAKNLLSLLIFALIFAGCTATTTEITDNSPAKSETSSPNQFASPGLGSTPPIQAASTDFNANGMNFNNLSRQDVRIIQQQLIDLGYKPGKNDGIIGKNSSMALLNFQRDYNLVETGKPNLETARMLEKKLNEMSSPVKDVQSSPAKPQEVSQIKEESVLAKIDNNQSSSRILVPGGINNNMNKLWKTAKNKCVDLRYSVATENRLTGNIVCVNKTKAGENMMIVNFDNTGFLVTTRGHAENTSKANMESVLKAAAGMRK